MSTLCWNRRLLGAVTCVLLALSFAGCASKPKVRVDQDSRANLGAYKTFGWYEAKSGDTNSGAAKSEAAKLREDKGVTEKAGSLMTQRVRTALANELQAKGYSFDESHPDFRVGYVLNVYERPKQSGMRLGLGAGGGSGNVGGGVGLSLPIGKRNETAAMMTIDVIDGTRNAQVWTGSYENVLKDTVASDDDVKVLVGTILSKFPAH